MANLTLINLETMRTIIENDVEMSSFDVPDFYDIEQIHFYAQRAVLYQQVTKMITLKREED